MIDLALVFGTALIMMMGAGGGWAALLIRRRRSSFATWGFWTFTTGIAVESIAWSWALGCGGGLGAAAILSTVVAVAGWVAAIRSGAWKQQRSGWSIDVSWAEAVVLLIALVVMVAPGLAGDGRVTLAFRIGPDAIGNAVGARALADGATIHTLQNDVIQATGSADIDQALSQTTRVLYTVPSFRSQVQSEFIVAGLRWGYSGAAAFPVAVLGPSRTWAVVTLMPVLAALFAALGILSMLRSFRVPPWRRLVGVVVAVLGVTLLNGLREGGLAQVWVLPCIVGFGCTLLDEESTDRERFAMAAIALAGLLPAYSDAAFVLAMVLLVSFGTAVLIRNRDRMFDHVWVAAGSLTGAVATGPYLVRFVAYIPKRVADSQVGGWSLPRWTSPSETLGLFNSYSQRVAGMAARSDLLQFAVPVADIILVGLTIAAIAANPKHRAAGVVTSATSTVVAFYVKARYVDHASNYQFFKAAGMAQPILGMALVLLWHNSGTTQRDSIRRSFSILTGGVGVLCLTSSVLYSVTFTEQERKLDIGQIDATSSSPVRVLLEARNIVGPSRFELMMTLR